MNFAEVIYETGDKSVVSYDDEAELIAAVKEQHDRAVNGLDAGPQAGRPAERVSRVLLYGTTHPADYVPSVNGDYIKSLVDQVSVGGELDVNEFNAKLAQATSPLVTTEGSRHDSLYKQTEEHELDSAEWTGAV